MNNELENFAEAGTVLGSFRGDIKTECAAAILCNITCNNSDAKEHAFNVGVLETVAKAYIRYFNQDMYGY